MTTEQRFEELRKSATKQPEEFARVFQLALLDDFEWTFEKVKTQKLILKARYSAWIAELTRHMDRWIFEAPLKGKRKAQVKRHLNVCFAIQQMLDFIDQESSRLSIWKVATENLLKALFLSIEQRRLKDEERVRKSAQPPENHGYGMQEAEFDRRELRYRCDFVQRVVNQISRFGVTNSSELSLTDSDVQRALVLARLTDMVLHILDCYTYKNYRVSVEDREIRLHGLRSTTQHAEDWSALRQHQKYALDTYDFVREFARASAMAEKLLVEAKPFLVFLETDAGRSLFADLESLRKLLLRILKRDVEQLIDLDFLVKTPSGMFKAGDLIDFWAALYQIAAFASLWCRARHAAEAPILPRQKLVELASLCLSWETDVANAMASQFILDPNIRNQDPFFRPLIKLNETDLLIACTFIETGRFSRNLFTIAIREGGVDFSPKGLKPLKELRKSFIEAGYRCELNVPVLSSGQVATDVDIAATKDNILFLGQTKVLIHPDTPYEDWKVTESLRGAGRQLRLCLEHIPFICDHFGLAEGKFSVVPFLLTNIWDFTGGSIGGYKVVDFSYLLNLLRGAEIWELNFTPEPRRRIKKLIKGKYPTGDELAQLISAPFHQEMFRPALLEEQRIKFGEWTLVVPVELVDESGERSRNAKIAKLARY